MRRSVVIFFLLVVCGCQPAASTHQRAEVVAHKDAARIVTLSPHLTELVFSLGAQDGLVGTVEYSDYPKAAKSIARIGNAFQLDWEAVTALKPDLIIGWQGGNPAAMLDKLEQQGFKLLRLENADLYGLPEQIERLANELGVENVADDLRQTYLDELDELKKTYRDKSKVKVFYQISAEPIYTVDGQHTISDMLELCGGVNVFDVLGKTSGPVTPEAVVAAAPEVIMTTSVAYDDIVQQWEGVFPPESVLAISGDEVARASLRMAQGARNICDALQEWRTSTSHGKQKG